MNAHLAITKGDTSLQGKDLCLEQVVSKGDGKQAFYQKLINAYETDWTTTKKSWYKHYYDRYYKKESYGATTPLHIQVRSQTPLVIGHGGNSVLETSLALHRIYGVPYLPGTALKGVASHYAHRQLGDQQPALKRTGSDYNILFGSQTSAGFIQFHDAFPTPATVCKVLKQDVLTAHHQDYNGIIVEPYRSDIEYKAPRDDDSPVPIPFLSASAHFGIILTCEGEQESAMKWLSLAKTILLGALRDEGIGAKTNAGYGRLLEIE
ncbi:type III-B CRISPR module RAMP protein Cmr6 [Paenibacillus polymyxa]|uniref:type III-B CRISPR module RAMP protein Cmr6 n=1 Tax=Paenibacillus polymyxa TaxID=1406 RepID=UPI001866BCA0|nr:type III-B CRISPR module RAMP protein Cmr6 [Paenibacillus polymyxa]MBE3650748.1 type III-B CRISPR module RAMP protein Cmr6 [Paenibacillus polymyxa]